jgi:integrase
MVRAQIRVFSLLARPGNSRRSSTAAASSPPCSYAVRIAAASASETMNILGSAVTGTKLSDKAVVRLVKQAALDAGLDPDGFSGHSLRAGLATAAGDAGAGQPELMRQTRHKSTAVALGYLRPAELWTNNVSARIFAAAGAPKEG